jgi:hypothetical protein
VRFFPWKRSEECRWVGHLNVRDVSGITRVLIFFRQSKINDMNDVLRMVRLESVEEHKPS